MNAQEEQQSNMHLVHKTQNILGYSYDTMYDEHYPRLHLGPNCVLCFGFHQFNGFIYLGSIRQVYSSFVYFTVVNVCVYIMYMYKRKMHSFGLCFMTKQIKNHIFP